MPWQYPLTTTDTSQFVNLGSTDSVFVAAQFAIVTTSTDAIIGSGSHHQAAIYGTVAGNNGIQLGSNFNKNNGQIVDVTATGTVYAGGYGIRLYGYSSEIHNDGTVVGHTVGALIAAERNSGSSEITNSGTIQSDGFAAVVTGGTQEIHTTNTGLIAYTGSAGGYAYQNGGSNEDSILNSGKMLGNVALGGGDDLYDGRRGSIDGKVSGENGADTLYGGAEKNVFDGGNDNDTLVGGGGADKLTGGEGADIFVFQKTSDSGASKLARDVIVDFVSGDGDVIDLHAIDANAKKAGNQAFHFIGTDAFHHQAGELRFTMTDKSTFVYADTNGDGTADFSIQLSGSLHLLSTDFTL